MKTSHSISGSKSRKRFLFAIIILTGLATSFFTSFGIWNDFNELTNYSSNEIVSVLLSAVVLGILVNWVYRMIRSNENNRTNELA